MKNHSKYIHLLLGLFLAAFSFNLFLAPYNLAAGGISGLALIVGKVFQINMSQFIMVANLILLVLSYFLLGKEATKNTILGSILFPIFLDLTSKITSIINLSNLELLVIASLGGILSGLGYGLIFKSGFTSGGTDILNQLLEKYWHIPISTGIILIDGLITLSTAFVFDISTMIYAIIALLLISTFSNKAIIGEGSSKTVYIYSEKYNEIKKYLHEELKIDSTDFETVGGYSKKQGHVILTVVNNFEYYKLKDYITQVDQNAFLVVTNSYQHMNANLTIKS